MIQRRTQPDFYRTLVASLLALFGYLGAAPLEAVQLAYNLKAGEQLVYRFTQSGTTTIQIPDQEPQEMKSEAQVTNIQYVKSIDPSGSAVVQMYFKDGKVTATTSGKTWSFPFEFAALRLKLTRSGSVRSADIINPEGKVITNESTGITGLSAKSLNLSQFFGQMSELTLPTGEVAVGDDWGQSLRFTSATGETVMITPHSTLKRMTEVRGYPCAEIETTVSVPMKAKMKLLDTDTKITGKYDITMTSHFAVDAGRLVDMTGKAKVDQELLLTLIPEGSKKKTTTKVLANSDLDFAMTLQ